MLHCFYLKEGPRCQRTVPYDTTTSHYLQLILNTKHFKAKFPNILSGNNLQTLYFKSHS
jgi:hypothetical protein